MTPSGKSFTVAGVDGVSSETIVATSTFLDHQDRYCRAYQRRLSSRPDIERLRGIACRDAADGAWHTRVLVAESAAAPADSR